MPRSRRFLFTLFFSQFAAWAVTTAGSPQIPLTFVENRGQENPQVKAVANGPRFKAWFESGGFLMQQGDSALRVDFVGGAANPAVTLAGPTGAAANYLRGQDPGQWRTGLPLFNTLHYTGVWQGVEVSFHQDRDRMKVEYTVSPGTGIDKIWLRFDGDVSIGRDGGLVARNGSGEFHESAPLMYQDIGGVRKVVPGGFITSTEGLVGFHAAYDDTKPLVIDPVIAFSGYFGGTGQDAITAVAVNSNFNTIVAGWTSSMDLPASGGVRGSSGGGVDAFVASFSPAGGQLIYCTYLGGSGDDRAFGVAVDASNNTYVTGWTSSANFPVAGGVQFSLRGARDAFVSKLNPAGTALVYSTYLGGTGVDTGNAIAVDSLGQAVIAGDTTSTNIPVTAGVFQRTLAGGQDAFVARLAANGASLSFMTYFGGNSTDHASAVQLDPTGPIVIGGGTLSTNLPLMLPAQTHSGGGQDGFVTKFNSTATGLVVSTYLGGSGGSPGLPEQVNALVIGPARNIIAVGITSSSNFPITSSAVQPVYGGGQTDGFLTRINGTTGVIALSTFLGGSLNDGINAACGDQLGRVYVTGFTTSTDFPALKATQKTSAGGFGGSMDAFVTTINVGMTAMSFSTYLGGSGSDSGNAIAVDALTSIVVAGQTGSSDFPIRGNMGNLMSDPLSSFVTRYAPDWTLSVASAPGVTVDTWHTAGLSSNSYSYGQAGDIPVAGDWTGSGVKRIGIFRDGIWLLDTNGDGVYTAGDKAVAFGQAGDIPVLGDWNGTGTIKLGLYRAGTFILDLSGHLSGVPTGISDAVFSFGLASDIPVTGDWNGSGTTKVGVFRAGTWLVDYNGDQVYNGLDKSYTYGQAGDIPVTGSWDSTGLTRIGVYRAGNWILNYNGNNVMGIIGQTDLSINFGSAGMTPVVR